jgi:ELWxxDGT repeat protein
VPAKRFTTARRKAAFLRGGEASRCLRVERLESRNLLAPVLTMVGDLDPRVDEHGAALGSSPKQLTAIGDRLWFSTTLAPSAAGESPIHQLHWTNGRSVRTIYRDDASNGHGAVDEIIDAGAHTLFETLNSDGRRFLHQAADSDSQLIREFVPSGGDCLPDYTTVGDALFFAAEAAGDAAGCELWKTDGTAAGTALASDLQPGEVGSHPKDLVAFKGKLFFFADDGVHGRQLWTTDGTPEGTARISALAAGPDSFRDVVLRGNDGRAICLDERRHAGGYPEHD